MLQKNAVVAEGAADYGISSPRIENGVTTWDKIKFGSYYKDAEVEPEPIKWRVLSVDGDDAFLLADQILDAKPYNEKLEDVTWETCTLREWLNEDFYNEAFDDEEKEAVIETMVVNEDNPSYDTEDKVYLLSIAEASNSAYGFDTKFNENSKTREAKNTDYAKVNNVWSSSSDVTVGNGHWWLRSHGIISSIASFVYFGGRGIYDGGHVHYANYGVRPALHINLSSSSWNKVGEVSSAGQGDDKPTASPEPTKEPTSTDEPDTPTEPTREPASIDTPITPTDPTKEPASTDNPAAPTEPTQTPTATAQPIPPTVTTQNLTPTSQPVLKQLKLSAVKYIMNTKKITGKVSVSKATVKIKVGKRAYKKAIVKGKKFTLKLNYNLKKIKVIIKVEKKGYKSLVKVYT